MFYAYNIGNEIGKEEMRGRGARAALGWRCRELRAREVRAIAVLLQNARRLIAGAVEAARTGRAAGTREGWLLPR